MVSMTIRVRKAQTGLSLPFFNGFKNARPTFHAGLKTILARVRGPSGFFLSNGNPPLCKTIAEKYWRTFQKRGFKLSILRPSSLRGCHLRGSGRPSRHESNPAGPQQRCLADGVSSNIVGKDRTTAIGDLRKKGQVCSSSLGKGHVPIHLFCINLRFQLKIIRARKELHIEKISWKVHLELRRLNDAARLTSQLKILKEVCEDSWDPIESLNPLAVAHAPELNLAKTSQAKS